MAVNKELLELDLYSVLAVGKKTLEKEVRAAGRELSRGCRGAWARASLFPPRPTPQYRGAVGEGRRWLSRGAACAALQVLS
uniref:Uncharacterized protein n=1 Tax=Otus sunia TaxID=257818 RepID=A0A8C8AWJ2_9STRI